MDVKENRQQLIEAEIDRHKSAIVRGDLSRPVRLAVEADVINFDTSFFDYGCGHGGDVGRLQQRGIEAQGWDPFYRPDQPHLQSDVVNLGYVLNVIEKPIERRQALLDAWKLAKKVLIVSAQVLLDYLSDGYVAYGDGVITKRNTFQKYFKQDELDEYISSTLGVKPVPVGLGIYFVFRNEVESEAFRASRFHSRRTTPTVKLRTKRFEDFEHILSPLMAFVAERGRLPIPIEIAEANSITREFGSLKAAFKFIQNSSNMSEWNHITERRKQDLLVYCALSKFSQSPKISLLPSFVQQDIKEFFGSYKSACDTADQMLFSLGNPDTINQKCKTSSIGKLVPDGLYVHVSALNDLDPILRLYEGCASRTIGRMNEATLVKFHIDKPKISYLLYPDFDTVAHPALQTSMRIDLRDLARVAVSDYSNSPNPPVLHRKETFVSSNYPLYERFAKLTKAEEQLGLLLDAKTIGTRNGWNDRLAKYSVRIEDHQIVDYHGHDLQDRVFTNPFNEFVSEIPLVSSPSVPSKKITTLLGANHMTLEELKQFINKGMSISHVYQPAILLSIIQNGGVSTLSQTADECSRLDGKVANSYLKALGRYPIEALKKRGIITVSEGTIKLNLDWTQISALEKDQLGSLIRSRLK